MVDFLVKPSTRGHFLFVPVVLPGKRGRVGLHSGGGGGAGRAGVSFDTCGLLRWGYRNWFQELVL